MSSYTILPAPFYAIADGAEQAIKLRFGLAKPLVETPIVSDLLWVPTLHWRTREGYVACEVHENPLPISVKMAFGDLSTMDLPIKIFVAIPKSSLSNSEFLKQSKEAKRYGCGLMIVEDDGVVDFQHVGIEVPLFFPTPKYIKFQKNIRAAIQHAYDIYINSDPRHGVQEIGSLIENAIIHLANQALKKGTFNNTTYKSTLRYYAQAKLIEELMGDRIIDNAILGKCRGFVEDRNATSHKPRSISKAIAANSTLKNAMQNGLSILEELPRRLREKGYTLKIVSTR